MLASAESAAMWSEDRRSEWASRRMEGVSDEKVVRGAVAADDGGLERRAVVDGAWVVDSVVMDLRKTRTGTGAHRGRFWERSDGGLSYQV